ARPCRRHGSCRGHRATGARDRRGAAGARRGRSRGGAAARHQASQGLTLENSTRLKGATTMADTNKTGLVVTAHPGDFVWRAGGAVALHAKKGYRVKIVCLSFGERGESQFAWKEKGATLASVKAGRKDEAERAAKLLGAEIEFFDCGDYPLKLTEAHF